LSGALSLEQAVDQIKLETRRYAKRQLTWLRGDGNVEWVPPSLTRIEELAGAWFS
jgi:tRNA dimethylallyltransferase